MKDKIMKAKRCKRCPKKSIVSNLKVKGQKGHGAPLRKNTSSKKQLWLNSPAHHRSWIDTRMGQLDEVFLALVTKIKLRSLTVLEPLLVKEVHNAWHVDRCCRAVLCQRSLCVHQRSEFASVLLTQVLCSLSCQKGNDFTHIAQFLPLLFRHTFTIKDQRFQALQLGCHLSSCLHSWFCIQSSLGQLGCTGPKVPDELPMFVAHSLWGQSSTAQLCYKNIQKLNLYQQHWPWPLSRPNDQSWCKHWTCWPMSHVQMHYLPQLKQCVSSKHCQCELGWKHVHTQSSAAVLQGSW